MTARNPDDIVHELDRAVWSLAAIVASVRDGDAAAAAVVDQLGLAGASVSADVAAAPLLQASRVIQGGTAWTEQDDDALLAQGRTSARAGELFEAVVLGQLEGLDFGLPARMLDVGVGVAAMAAAFCQRFPSLSVVGLDVNPRSLELARDIVAEAGVADRVELRLEDVAALPDRDAFDLAWLPAPFIPRAPLEAGLRQVAGALRPGGWVLLGHGRLTGDPLDVAITRFKTVAYGGTPLDDGEAEALLRAAGFTDVRSLALPEQAPAMAAGRR